MDQANILSDEQKIAFKQLEKIVKELKPTTEGIIKAEKGLDQLQNYINGFEGE